MAVPLPAWCSSRTFFGSLVMLALSAPEPAASTTAARADVAGAEEQLPRDFHNLFVIVVVGLILAWMGKVLYQLFRAADLNARLARTQSLQLEGMSIYATDFQMLIRQHFNQILRIRRTVPPKPVTRHALSIHLHPDSISVWSSDAAGGVGNRAGSSFGVQFTVDALVPCCVKLYWGVSIPACNEFVQRRQNGSQASGDTAGRWGSGRGGKGSGGRGNGAAVEGNVGRGRRWPRPPTSAQESTRSLLEMEELNGITAPGAGANEDNQNVFAPGQFKAQSRDFFLPAGVAQRYVTPAGDLIDPTQLPFDVSASWLRDGQAADDASVMPLAIVILAQRRPNHELGNVQGRPVVEARGQISFVKFRRAGDGGVPRAPEIIRQLSFGDRSAAYEIHGVYGFEDEGEGDCMICYTRPKNVLLLPCRHCSVCHPCLRSLRDEKCPLCRSIFSSYATFPISRAAPSTEGLAPRGAGPGPQAGDPQPPPPSGDTGEQPGTGGGGSLAGGNTGSAGKEPPLANGGSSTGGGSRASSGGGGGGAGAGAGANAKKSNGHAHLRATQPVAPKRRGPRTSSAAHTRVGVPMPSRASPRSTRATRTSA
mmetsp:Transcript_100015/g.322487  ORF Transcript_100015/g.322487 Transcript_100015/m.322487 type:complete len:594 (-) Transcript_100015:1551-3332(-)